MFGFARREKAIKRPLDVYDLTGEDDGARAGFAGGRASGLIAGSDVATPKGWCPVDKISAGDQVLTFDSGVQKVRATKTHHLWTRDVPCPKKFWPLFVPAGALGNLEETLLLPDQKVMIESDAAEMLHGERFPLIPALALLGWRGIRRIIPAMPVQIVAMQLDIEQVVLTNIGVQVLCKGVEKPCSLAKESGIAYQALDLHQATALVEFLEISDNDRGATVKAAAPNDKIYAAFAA